MVLHAISVLRFENRGIYGITCNISIAFRKQGYLWYYMQYQYCVLVTDFTDNLSPNGTACNTAISVLRVVQIVLKICL